MVDMIRQVPSVSKELVDGLMKNFSESIGWQLSETSAQELSRCFHFFFSATTDFLSKVKSTDHPVAIVAEDMYQNFMFGIIVEYHKNDNEEMPGNWSMVYTFDAKDIEACGEAYSVSGNEFKDMAISIGENMYGYLFTAKDGNNILEQKRIIVTQIMANVAKTIRQWVEENSVSAEPVSTEIGGKVIIDAMVDETGTKVFSITPSGELKNIIKDDAAIESKKDREKAAEKKKKK